jgi:hypothetical protein
MWTPLHVSFKNILIRLISFTGAPNSMRILCNNYPLTES